MGRLNYWGPYRGHLFRKSPEVNEEYLAPSLQVLITQKETGFCLFTIHERISDPYWM